MDWVVNMQLKSMANSLFTNYGLRYKFTTSTHWLPLFLHRPLSSGGILQVDASVVIPSLTFMLVIVYPMNLLILNWIKL